MCVCLCVDQFRLLSAMRGDVVSWGFTVYSSVNTLSLSLFLFCLFVSVVMSLVK